MSVFLADAVKCSGSHAAVDGVTADIPDGAFFVVLGPAGSRQDHACDRRPQGFRRVADGDVFNGDEVWHPIFHPGRSTVK